MLLLLLLNLCSGNAEARVQQEGYQIFKDHDVDKLCGRKSDGREQKQYHLETN